MKDLLIPLMPELSVNPFNFGDLIRDMDIDISQYTDREKIEIIEWFLAENFENIADDLPVRNFINADIYARELTIPAGIVLTGKIHKEAHICVLSQGDLSVMTDDGLKRVQAPYIFNAREGLKKIGLSHTACVFTTFHQAHGLTDIDDLENKLLLDSDLSWVDKLMEEKQRLIA
jgi:hypothetical protein